MAMDDEAGASAVTYRALLTDSRLGAVVLLTFVGMIGVHGVPPVLPAISESLGVPDDRIGLVMTAFFLPAAVALPVVAVVADLVGRRPVALGSLVLFGLAGTGVYFVESFAAILLLRGVQGLAFPGLVPLSITLTGDLYTGAAGTTAQGLRLSVNGIGSTLSPLVAGALAGLAWPVPFLLFAVAFPAVAVVAATLPETRTGAADGPAGVDVPAYLRAVAAELADRDLALLVIGGFAVFFAQFAVLTFVPLFAVRHLGASSFVAGALIAVFGGTRIVISPLAGPVVARVGRTPVIVAGTGLAGTCTLLMAGVGSVLGLGGLLFAFAFGLALFTPTLNDAVTGMASPTRRAGVVNVMEVGKTGAIAASPAAFGLVLAGAGFGALFGLAAAVFVAYATVALVFLRG